MRNFEITKREVLASISIIAVMILVGILISAKITERQCNSSPSIFSFHLSWPSL